MEPEPPFLPGAGADPSRSEPESAPGPWRPGAGAGAAQKSGGSATLAGAALKKAAPTCQIPGRMLDKKEGLSNQPASLSSWQKWVTKVYWYYLLFSVQRIRLLTPVLFIEKSSIIKAAHLLIFSPRAY